MDLGTSSPKYPVNVDLGTCTSQNPVNVDVGTSSPKYPVNMYKVHSSFFLGNPRVFPCLVGSCPRSPGPPPPLSTISQGRVNVSHLAPTLLPHLSQVLSASLYIIRAASAAESRNPWSGPNAGCVGKPAGPFGKRNARKLIPSVYISVFLFHVFFLSI